MRVWKYFVHRTSTRWYDRRRIELSSPGVRQVEMASSVGLFSTVSTARMVGVYGQPECHSPPTLSRHESFAGCSDQSACTACRWSKLRGTEPAADLVGRRRERVAHRPVGASGLLARQLQLDAAIATRRAIDQLAVPQQLREQPQVPAEVRVLRRARW